MKINPTNQSRATSRANSYGDFHATQKQSVRRFSLSKLDAFLLFVLGLLSVGLYFKKQWSAEMVATTVEIKEETDQVFEQALGEKSSHPNENNMIDADQRAREILFAIDKKEWGALRQYGYDLESETFVHYFIPFVHRLKSETGPLKILSLNGNASTVETGQKANNKYKRYLMVYEGDFENGSTEILVELFFVEESFWRAGKISTRMPMIRSKVSSHKSVGT